MNLPALWTLFLEAVKVSQLMDGSDQSVTTTTTTTTTTAVPTWGGNTDACNPDGRTGVKMGFCAGTSQLETKCARLDISRSADCSPYEGHWCCYIAGLDVSKTLGSAQGSRSAQPDAPAIPDTTTLPPTTTTITIPPTTTPVQTSIPTTITTTTTTVATTTTATTTVTTTNPPTTTQLPTTTALNTSSNGSLNRVLDHGNDTALQQSDNGETVWKWSTGQSSLVIATNKGNVVTTSNDVPDQVVATLPVAGWSDGFRRGRHWMSPSTNPCLMWMLGSWVDCWSQ